MSRKTHSLQTLIKSLNNPDIVQEEVAYDEFTCQIMIRDDNKDMWRPLTDDDYTNLRLKLEVGNIEGVGKELIRDVISFLTNKNRIDTAQIWLNSLPTWDGIKRIESFLINYFSCADTAYARAVSNYIFSAVVGRIMQPGVKADMVPVFYGPQGAGKSSGISAIVPNFDFYVEINLSRNDDDLTRLMRGRLIGELSELNGLKGKALESIKSFVTRTKECWRPIYKEFTSSYLRRIIFIGSTNDKHFLDDETGNRRWLPIDVGSVNVKKIKLDAAQLWAEARECHTEILWEEAESLAKLLNHDYVARDIWFEPVHNYLVKNNFMPFDAESHIPQEKYISTVRILSDALSISEKDMTRGHQMRVGKVMALLGFEKKSVRLGKKTQNVYFFP